MGFVGLEAMIDNHVLGFHLEETNNLTLLACQRFILVTGR